MARLWTKPSRRWRSRIPTMQQTPFIRAKAGIQGPRPVALGPRFRGDERKVWLRLRALALVAAMREASATNLQGDSHGLRPRSIRVGLPRYSQARWRTPGARAGASEARAAALQPGLRRDLLRRKCTARTEGALRGSRSRLSDSVRAVHFRRNRRSEEH